MEALGAVSSILSIIDAAAAVAGLIQKATDVQVVLKSTKCAIERLRLSEQENDVELSEAINKVIGRLQHELLRLKTILLNVTTKDDSVHFGHSKVRYRRYFQNKKKLESLRACIFKSRTTLTELLSVTHLWQSVALGLKIDSIEFLRAGVPSVSESDSTTCSQADESLSKTRSKSIESTTTLASRHENEVSNVKAAELLVEETITSLAEQSLDDLTPLRSDGVVISTSRLASCVPSCDCPCHQGSRLTTPKWLRGMVGVLFSNYDGKPLFRALSLTYTWNAVNGVDGKLAFRIPRVLPPNEINSIYAILRTSSVKNLEKYMKGMRIKPFDLDDKGRSLAHTAAWASNYEQYYWLIEAGADPCLPDDQGLTAIDAWVGYFLALPDQAREVWTERIDFHRWKEAIERMDFSILHDVVLGIADSKLDVSKVLKHRINIDQQDSYGRTALFWACVRGREADLRQLLLHGADAHLADAKQYTPLHWLAWNGSAGCLRVLLEAGVDPNITSMDHRTALHVAAQCKENRSAVLGLLLQNGADVEVHDAQGKTALHRAAERGHADHVLDLVRKGADIESRNSLGFTPLISAVEYNSVQSTCALLQLGAKHGVLDNQGANILHHVALWAGQEMMQLLSKLPLLDVDPELRDRSGRTPLDCLEQQRDQFYGAQCAREVEEDSAVFEILLRSVMNTTLPRTVAEEKGPSQHDRTGSSNLGDVGRLDTSAPLNIPGSWDFV